MFHSLRFSRWITFSCRCLPRVNFFGGVLHFEMVSVEPEFAFADVEVVYGCACDVWVLWVLHFCAPPLLCYPNFIFISFFVGRVERCETRQKLERVGFRIALPDLRNKERLLIRNSIMCFGFELLIHNVQSESVVLATNRVDNTHQTFQLLLLMQISHNRKVLGYECPLGLFASKT